MAGQLEGKVSLVTGGGSGIGKSTALEFAREGAKVVVADVNSAGGEETVTQIRSGGGEAIFVHADVSRAAHAEAMVEAAVEAYDRLDCAHNNAGIEGIRVPTADFLEDEWERVIAVDLKGVWLSMKYEIAQMMKQGSGAIVNTSSIAGLIGMKGSTAYGAAKHGVIGLTKTAAVEYATQGIRVNAVCPGAISTPMVERLMGRDPEREAMYMSIQPIGRFGTPEEVGQAVVWLCSDASSFVTGIAMPVDGGTVAN